MPSKLNQKVIQEAIRDYVENKLSIVACAKKHNIGATTLSRYISKNNISKNVIDNRIYTYNERYFEIIDTEEKAYWLGFIAADGCIINNESGLEIGLSSKDRSHLEKFIISINGDMNMITDLQRFDGKNLHNASRVRVINKQMCKDLAQWEIVPRKSEVLGFPTFLSKKLLRHYLRGYFDGDGSICSSGKDTYGNLRHAVSIIASKDFLDDYMNHMIEFGVTKNKLQSRNKMYAWNKMGNNQIRIVLNYLYRDSSIFLERKHIKYLAICSPELNSH